MYSTVPICLCKTPVADYFLFIGLYNRVLIDGQGQAATGGAFNLC